MYKLELNGFYMKQNYIIKYLYLQIFCHWAVTRGTHNNIKIFTVYEIVKRQFL